MLDKLGFMNKSEREEILSQLSRYDINIGIKSLIDVLMVSKYSRDTVDEVVNNIVEKMSG